MPFKEILNRSVLIQILNLNQYNLLLALNIFQKLISTLTWADEKRRC